MGKNPAPASPAEDSLQKVSSEVRPPVKRQSSTTTRILVYRRFRRRAHTRTTPPPSTPSTAIRCAPPPTPPIPPATDESRRPVRFPRSSPAVPPCEDCQPPRSAASPESPPARRKCRATASSSRDAQRHSFPKTGNP